MYKWYWEAAACYAYLADVTGPDEQCRSCLQNRSPPSRTRIQCGHSFGKPGWFTRSWTVQELLAPVLSNSTPRAGNALTQGRSCWVISSVQQTQGGHIF
ncbi:hypothetical protein BU25DRAFT_408955 [Macroventuria anomochaeta]|uniref:Uncharacterized protein n=1 Tax=Macroventuria anomochaeta TaxID=301207 RepID=A0ACB6S848_9PLEO|nr:uncharacterized protein BU25DRAFT_408955 [Macroventuria anomochaeta]KAF2629682.1 hypothetical protein BU25DRAFT_408955 [Macroventuria anomochaeta]